MSENKWTRGKWKAFRKPTYGFDEGRLTGIGTNPDRWVLKSEIEHRPPQDGIARTTIHFAEFFRCGQMSDEELEANVRLAEAAPAMAEALKPFQRALTWFESRMTDDMHMIDEKTHMIGCEITVADLRRAVAALSLARGEAK